MAAKLHNNRGKEVDVSTAPSCVREEVGGWLMDTLKVQSVTKAPAV